MFFGIFPHMLGTLAGVEKCQTIRKLHLVAWDFVGVIFSLKLGFWQIDVFTKYCCCNSSKRPQMPQKWIRTILFGSGCTLDTLNRGLGPFFLWFSMFLAPWNWHSHAKTPQGNKPSNHHFFWGGRGAGG